LHYRTRTALVVVQVALGLVLLVGAGLVVRTFRQLQRVDPGFRADGVLTFRLALPRARYATPERMDAFTRELDARLAALPGVEAAGAVSHVPYDHLPNWGGPYLVESGQDESHAPMADYRAVTPGFFAAVDARVVQGRAFSDDDGLRQRPVVIVDERLARRAWPGRSPIGMRLGVDPRSEGRPTTWATVVGVVRHLRHRTLMEEVREQVYFPQAQILRNPLAYVVRTSGEPAAAASSVRAVVAGLDPLLPVYDVRPLSDYLVAARAAQRFTMILAGAFAAVALLLACVGLYGVIAYAVARRRHEFGIRLALGARPGQVQRLVVGEGVRLAVLGLALGVPAAAIGARLLQAQLFGVSPRDPASYALALGLLGLAAVLASWVAARRATAASPLDVLRAE
jgi:predicted permease